MMDVDDGDFQDGGASKTNTVFGARSSSAEKTTRSKPWVEKHRPKKVTDIASQSEVVSFLQKCFREWTLPHLLFYGPPGTGKTSTILAAARQMFGADFKKRVLELNASDDRGISVVRDKVKMFAQGAVTTRGSSGKRIPPFKLIVLDEADSLTSAAQDALRRTMEKHSKVTRFCLICNYVSRITGPISSRCTKFRFTPLARDTMEQQLRMIAQRENVPLSDVICQRLLECSGGDMRKAITSLQSCWQLYGDEMSPASVDELSGVIPSKLLDGLWETIVKNRDIDGSVDAVDNLVAEGFSASAVIAELHKRTVRTGDISDIQKSRILMKLSEADLRLADRTDEHLVLLDTACYVAQTMIE